MTESQAAPNLINGKPFEARTSRNGANKREMLTAKLTAEPRENHEQR